MRISIETLWSHCPYLRTDVEPCEVLHDPGGASAEGDGVPVGHADPDKGPDDADGQEGDHRVEPQLAKDGQVEPGKTTAIALKRTGEK